jgi:DNA polymerase
MAGRIVLDVETRSTLDLKKVGAARYAAHPSTDVWCVAWALDDGPVQLWIPGDPVAAEIADASEVIAHNAGFERAIFRHILTKPPHYWPDIPLDRWRCTMAAGLALALPARLAQVAKALSLPEQKANKTIVSLMMKPRRPRGNEDPSGVYWFDDLEHRQALYDYCRQDVETERALYHWLLPLGAAEQALWQLDQIINERGFYTDGALIEKAIAIATAAEREIQVEFQRITGLNSTNQVEKTLAWLAAHGCVVADLQKPTCSAALRRTALTPGVRRAIELRREAAHAAANKFPALQAWRGEDGRVRNWATFHGAGTGRWSAQGPQPQNFRKEADGIAAKFAAVMTGDIATVRAAGAPIEIIGDVARCAICAPPGYKLLTADYSAIESRVLAWIADEPAKMAMWAKFDETGAAEDDPYVIIGRKLGFPKETARQFGKIADLAFGYGGGIGAYRNFAPEDDNVSEAEIKRQQITWRAQHVQIEQFWHGIERAAISAIHNSPQPERYGRLTLRCERLHDIPFLFITLPSGRSISYPFVRLFRRERGSWAVSFMDNAILTGGWTEYRPGRGMWGGGFTENIVQGIARDLLAAAMTRLEASGYPIVLHVHDAIVCEVPNGASELP